MSVQRRVSARRGSTSALDPFGVHAELNQNPNRSTSSILTIVRVPGPAPAPPPNLNEPPPSPILSQRRLHRRVGQTSTPPADPSSTTTRMSFAFSSFGGPQSSPARERPPSPSTSPRLRPSSPHLSTSSSTFGGRPRLTPDQLVDLARQATVPHPSPAAVAPATFTPLPDDIYLPFIDRPSEVNSLISSPPDVKLFSLLAQTFTNKSNVHDPSIAPLSDIEIPRDPTQWTYQQLIRHLTEIDRDVAPDSIWAIAARKCILSHSELLWERIKGALGLPPELDVDYDFIDGARSESPDTDDISDDEGRAARGHWSDWDSVMDSPVLARKVLSGGSSAAASLYHGKRPESPHTSIKEQEATFKAQIEDRLRGLRREADHRQPAIDLDVPTTGENTITHTPHGRGAISPPLQELDYAHVSLLHPTANQDATPLEGADCLSIEPLLAPSVSLPSLGGPPPLSLTSGDGLGDIAEGAEEEEAEADITHTTSGSLGVPGPGLANEDNNLISPSQIQGLKISTSPLPAFNSFGTPPQLLSPISPLPPYPPVPAPNPQTETPPIPISHSHSRSHSRASSFSSIGPFNRSESGVNLVSSWSANMGNWKSRFGSDKAQSDYAGSDYGDGGSVDGDVRAAGLGPLFVSNFARLAGGPTLNANDPAVRSSVVTPQARYGGRTKARAYSHGSDSASPPPGQAGKAKRESWGTGSRVVEGRV